MPCPRILCLSNGHGEDQIACRIAAELHQLGTEVIALPVVGEGKAYRHLNVPILGTTQVMPSGGFIYQDWRQFCRDLQGGLLGLTWRQMRSIRAHRRQVDLVLAVGDIVVLIMAWLSGAPYVFVGTAKSDYYWRDEQGCYRRYPIPWMQPTSDYFLWERWLMARPRCLGVFPRDSLTSRSLQRLGLRVYDLGNPMMDGFDLASPSWPIKDLLPDPAPALLVLPGSRPPEAYRNWQRLMAIVARLPSHIQVYAAIPSSLSLDRLGSGAQERQIHLIQGHFEACVQRATVVLAMAGTATEQCVGMGKPVVTIAGEGPQFTPRFAEAQTRLLGPSVTFCSAHDAPQAILTLIDRLAREPEFQKQLHTWGRQRMGSAGASASIARHLVQLCQERPQQTQRSIWEGGI